MMKRQRRLMRSVACAAMLLAGCGAVVAVAQEQRPSRNAAGRSWLDRIRPGRASTQYERNYRTVKEAFRKVAQPASESTVRVLQNGRPVALGTVVDAQGWIVTKASELGEPDHLACRLHDGRILRAQITGSSEECDVALLHIDTDGLVPVHWAESDDLPLGSWVVCPSMDELPAAAGVVSVPPRRISGGKLGVMLVDRAGTVAIDMLVPGSPAAQAGLSRGDIVVEVDGRPTKNRDEVVQMLSAFPPGHTVHLGVLRDGKQLSIDATLGSANAAVGNRRADFQNALGGPLSSRRDAFPMALQHDAVLSPRDCGGPLVNLDGRTVGINIARASRLGCLALPASVLRPLVDELKSGQLSPVASQH